MSMTVHQYILFIDTEILISRDFLVLYNISLFFIFLEH